jgi:hypothetical protein
MLAHYRVIDPHRGSSLNLYPLMAPPLNSRSIPAELSITGRSGSFVPFTVFSGCFTDTAMRTAKKNPMQNVPNAPASFVALSMNGQKEQDFWMELFSVKIRYEERRDAALKADLELFKGEQTGSAAIANLAKTNHTTFSTTDHE